MIEIANKLTGKTPPTLIAALVMIATVGLMMLLGAAPADAATAPVGGDGLSVEIPAHTPVG